MPSKQEEKPPAGPAVDLTIEKDMIDPSSLRLEMVIGAALMLVTSLTLYWPVLGAGFLLDDFLHLDYVARAAAGDWHDFLSNFTGNWAGSDIMKSYRPVVSLSVLIDYLLWGTNASGFHLTNILLLAGSCLFTALVTLEITGLYGNRLKAAAAIWAGLLFAVYPLHGEAVAWIIGRVDLLSTLFYLASLFSYLRYRRLREKPYLWSSLLLFLLSLTSKEMAVTLPVVVALLEFLLPPPEGLGTAAPGDFNGMKARLIRVGLFWLVLLAAAAGRFLLLGTLIGGYNTPGNPGWILQAPSVLFDRQALLKIILPLNEELTFPPWLPVAMITVFVIAVLMTAVRCLLRAVGIRAILSIAVVIPLTVLPALQVWHIYPNLVGSRLFYLGSAPLCILLAVMLLPVLDSISRRSAQTVCIAGTMALAALFASWSTALAGNLAPWVEAGRLMKALRYQIEELGASVHYGKHIVLLDLPRDLMGSGMVTRPLYLTILARPPFASKDVSAAFKTLDTDPPGDPELISPDRLISLLCDRDTVSTYQWSFQAGSFLSWQPPSGAAAYTLAIRGSQPANLHIEPETAIVAHASRWHLESEARANVIRHEKHLEIHPGITGVTLSFPNVPLDPRKAVQAQILLKVKSHDRAGRLPEGKIRLLWRSENGRVADFGPASGYSGYINIMTADLQRGTSLIQLDRYRSWSLDGRVDELALRFDRGDYIAEFAGLEIAAPQILSAS